MYYIKVWDQQKNTWNVVDTANTITEATKRQHQLMRQHETDLVTVWKKGRLNKHLKIGSSF